jgi:hypothetical protein
MRTLFKNYRKAIPSGPSTDNGRRITRSQRLVAQTTKWMPLRSEVDVVLTKIAILKCPSPISRAPASRVGAVNLRDATGRVATPLQQCESSSSVRVVGQLEAFFFSKINRQTFAFQ